jgi:hypothetical protein
MAHDEQGTARVLSAHRALIDGTIISTAAPSNSDV